MAARMATAAWQCGIEVPAILAESAPAHVRGDVISRTECGLQECVFSSRYFGSVAGRQTDVFAAYAGRCPLHCGGQAVPHVVRSADTFSDYSLGLRPSRLCLAYAMEITHAARQAARKCRASGLVQVHQLSVCRGDHKVCYGGLPGSTINED